MARASARSAPPKETVTLSPLFLKCLLALALLTGAALLLWRFDAYNDRLQTQRRLSDHPVLGGWYQSLCGQIEEVEAGRPGSARRPEAFWIGKVSRRELGNPAGQAPILLGVTLAPAHLLAGRRSAKDGRGHAVRISVKDFAFPHGQPQIGEHWAFAVYRINDGHSVAYDAKPVP